MLQSRNFRLMLFVLIFLLGAASRIIHIDDLSLWVDEGYAYYHSNNPDLILSLSRDTHPPLYFATFRLWQEVAGRSELSLRYFSYLPSMLSMALITLLAAEVVRARGGNPRQSLVPLLAALFMALADSENFLSQEARHYTWLVFWVTGSMWAFLRWLRTGERRALYIWVICTVAVSYTHYLGTLTGVVQGLYALLFLRGRQRLQAIGALVVSALLLSPWLLLVGRQQIGHDGYQWSQSLSLELLRDIRRKWFGDMWPLTMGLALLGSVTLVYGRRIRTRLRPLGPHLLLLMWALIPFLLVVILNEFIPVLQPRRLTTLTPPLVLLLAFGVANFRPPARAFLIAVLVVYGVTTVDYDRPKPPWRELTAQVAPLVQPDDLALIDIAGGDFQMLYYFEQMLPPQTRIVSLKNWRTWETDTYYTGLPELVEQYDTVWFMYWNSSDDSGPRILQKAGFVETAQFRQPHAIAVNVFIDLIIYRYDRPPAEPLTTYENGMQLLSAAYNANSGAVSLLWAVDEPLAEDYTVSAFLLDSSGRLVAQHDGYPAMNTRPTSTWPPATPVYDWHILETPDGTPLPAGTYQLAIKLYRQQDGAFIIATTEAGTEWYTVDTVEIGQ